MALTPGTRLGPYEIMSPLGVGGMGEVYRARDTKLDRDVAIKILPEAFVFDPERVARFQREAKVLASLNHLTIAMIHGLEESDGITALVMELVEGEDLSQRIARGAIPIDEALPIARQIAEALEAAHEQGIIHRDLKPANIKVQPDGTVKVLDFGLAKAIDPVGSAPNISQSPTITTPAMMTGVGIILGTAAYMAPEQAKGRAADKRSDIWAFGCVLYEMLTGRVAFAGEDVTETIAAVVRDEPDWSLLPAAMPQEIRTLLRHCLHKDQRRRWQDAASLRIGIDDALAAPIDLTGEPGASQRALNRRWTFVTAFSVLGAAAISALVVWNLRTEDRPATVARLLVGVSPAGQLARALPFPNARPFRIAIALSPNGQSLVFVGQAASAGGSASPAGSRQLYLRTMDRLDAMAIPGTEGAESPFFSPDGQWVGFWQSGPDLGALGELKKVPVRGGPVATLCRTALPGGISWGSNGRIVFGNHRGGGLWQVSDAGGTPQELTRADPTKGEFSHRLPHVLPGGRAVLFTIQKSGSWNDAQIVVRSLAPAVQTQTLLVEGAADARYVPSGHLVYARMGTLMAQPFDLARLEVTGEPVGIVDNVMHDVNSRFEIGNSGAAQFSVSASGTLAYLPGGVSPEGLFTAVWVDRRGGEEDVRMPRRILSLRPRLSPDGQRIAFTSTDGIGVLDIARETLSLLTPDEWGGRGFGTGSQLRVAAWHPDGKRIAFTGVDGNLFLMAADGSGTAEPLTTSDGESVSPGRIRLPGSWSGDGRTLALIQRQEAQNPVNRDIWTLSLGGGRSAAQPFLATPFDEPSVEFSPDGRYLAYESNQSGQSEVYVQPYPGPGKRELVSINGGRQPAWAHSGRELFYWAPGSDATTTTPGPGSTTKMMAVNVTLGETFTAARPRVLFEWMSVRYPGGTGGRAYDVTPDAKRFLMIRQGDDASEPAITQIVLVQNWLDELKRLVPTR